MKFTKMFDLTFDVRAILSSFWSMFSDPFYIVLVQMSFCYKIVTAQKLLHWMDGM